MVLVRWNSRVVTLLDIGYAVPTKRIVLHIVPWAMMPKIQKQLLVESTMESIKL